MAQRITEQQVAGAFSRLARTAASAGVDTSGWSVQRVDGPWTLFNTKPGETSVRVLVRLGKTKGEAFDRLHALADGIDLVRPF
jgi:hypothetical protein